MAGYYGQLQALYGGVVDVWWAVVAICDSLIIRDIATHSSHTQGQSGPQRRAVVGKVENSNRAQQAYETSILLFPLQKR